MNKINIKPQRIFTIGDNWLYYKIFTKETNADYILNKFQLIINDFIKSDIVSKWFYIRYNEEGFHIRIRLFVVNNNNIGYVILKFKLILNELIEEHIIWNVQLATYIRELERYNWHSIDVVERIFFIDSEIILNFLFNKEDNKIRFSMKHINFFLESFGYKDLESKIEFTRIMYEAFFKEFKFDKNHKVLLDINFRALKKSLSVDIFDDESYENSRYEILSGLCHEVIDDKAMNGFVASIIHMSVNRLFMSNNRLYEMVSYYFLNKYFKTLSYINR